jgi:ATP-dependent DNA helicase RecG
MSNARPTEAQTSPTLKGQGDKIASKNMAKAALADTIPDSLLSDYPRLPGLSPTLYTKLQMLCGPRWIDLLFHLPTRMLDRSSTPTIAAAPVDEVATFVVNVVRIPPFPPKFTKRPLAIELTDDTAPLRAIYFNPGSWLTRAYPAGGTVIVSGKVEADSKGKKIIHPDVWSLPERDKDSPEDGPKFSNIARIWPLYPLTSGLGQGWLSRSIRTSLSFMDENPFPEWLPSSFLKQHNLPTFKEALKAVHSPQTAADVEPNTPARNRLALDELYATQLALQHARATTRSLPGIPHGRHDDLQRRALASLPYSPTNAQTRALAEIKADLQAPRPMLRLLQGDVGAGKTLVALLALLHVIENGYQGTLMAPTEILARQLYTHARTLLEPLGITVGLLTGSMSAAQKKRLKQHVEDGFVNLLVGTHALVEDDVIFNKLGLAVVDEQHRFGVKQRVAISKSEKLPPDMLVMTATPIPRTLALTAFGDMDVSVLDEKPAGRIPIATHAVPDARIAEIANRLTHVLDKGEQAYWVCPLVEESEDSDLAAATQRVEWLKGRYGNKVGLLHGKMKAADKTEAMEAFQRGDTRILVATTVIEVGVDVPNATVMVIEHAERFGLAQLHQLRGRVGRGGKASHCILLYTPPLTPYAQERLQALRDSEDGFYLAEKDLELRGPGEVLGTRQSGEVRTRLADLHHHKTLIPLARDLAEKALARPLTAPQRNALATLLAVFNKHTAATWLRSG